jgi:hypothetical protein
MKKQTLEEAAKDFLKTECRIYTAESKMLAHKAFKAGAEWRINSVWHDINKEKPQDGKQCLLEITYKNGYVPYYHLTQWYEMNEFVFHDRCAKVRWAYIEDLLPNMED